MVINKSARKNWLGMANHDFARRVKSHADVHLSHLFAVSEFDVLKVLLALENLCEETGKDIQPEIALKELAWEEAATGFKFLMWAM